MPLDPICKKIVSNNTEYASDYGGKNITSAVPNANKIYFLWWSWNPQRLDNSLAHSALGYEIFNEARQRIQEARLSDEELERVLILAKTKKVQMYDLIRRQKV